MAISVSAPKIGLRLVGMADGSTAIMTERGELLERQFGISINSTPGGDTIATVEFLVDHDKVRLEKPDEHVDIPGFTANISNLYTEEEKRHWAKVAEELSFRRPQTYAVTIDGKMPDAEEVCRQVIDHANKTLP